MAIRSLLGALADGLSPVSEGQRLDPQPASKIPPATITPTFLDNIIMKQSPCLMTYRGIPHVPTIPAAAFQRITPEFRAFTLA